MFVTQIVCPTLNCQSKEQALDCVIDSVTWLSPVKMDKKRIIIKQGIFFNLSLVQKCWKVKGSVSGRRLI